MIFLAFMVVCTAVSGCGLLLIAISTSEFRKTYTLNNMLKWILWVCPQEVNKLAYLDIFLIMVFEIFFGLEIILVIYSMFMIMKSIRSAENIYAQCEMALFLYLIIICVYITLLLFYMVKRGRIKITHKYLIDLTNKKIEKIKVYGGGIHRALSKGLLLLLILIWCLEIKIFCIELTQKNVEMNLLLWIFITLLFIVWFTLMLKGKIQSMIVDKEKIIYRETYAEKQGAVQ